MEDPKSIGQALDDICDRVEELEEKYRMHHEEAERLTAEILSTTRQRDTLAEALRGISPEIECWFHAAEECQCVSPQPIGACLKCDMAGISITIEDALAAINQ